MLHALEVGELHAETVLPSCLVVEWAQIVRMLDSGSVVRGLQLHCRRQWVILQVCHGHLPEIFVSEISRSRC